MNAADRLGTVAAACAAASAAAGLLVPDLYRDPAVAVPQGRGLDAATLFIVVPTLAVALRRGSREHQVWRLVALSALITLVYVYAQFAFTVVVNPATALYIATLGFAAWSAALIPPLVDVSALGSTLAARVPRRTTAAVFALVAVVFAALWLGQLVDAALQGVPDSLRDAELPTNPIWALDLGFVLPAFGLVALGLLRRDARAAVAAIPGLVFLALFGASMLCLTIASALSGQTLEGVLLGVFGTVVLAALALLAVTFAPAAVGVAQSGR